MIRKEWHKMVTNVHLRKLQKDKPHKKNKKTRVRKKRYT